MTAAREAPETIAMPVFVHLTSHRNIPAIRRGGIARGRWTGVYALPVTRNFQVSHQWLRELRRFGSGTVVGVYFRLPDEEPVEIGHYNSRRLPMTAAEATALMLAAEQRDPVAAREADRDNKAVQRGRVPPSSPEGFEVVIPRSIARSEFLRIKPLPQVIGWRYRPGANGTPPCLCICCEKGNFGVRKLARRADEEERLGKRSKLTVFGRD